VADRPFARGEIRDRHQRGKRNENSNSTFHVRPRRTDLRDQIPSFESAVPFLKNSELTA
jgi:hypothetical protein